VSLRTATDPGTANRWSPARIPAPAGERDPGRRIALIHQLIVAARATARLDAVSRIAPVGTYLPRWALPALSARATGIDFQVSNIAGWASGDLYFAGARVRSAHPFGPLPGVAGMVTLLSVNGTCHVGVNYDPAAVTEPAVFADCLAAGFDEMRELAATRGIATAGRAVPPATSGQAKRPASRRPASALR
jgi:diacylglycerol O-acyltransferase / wax synthase